MKPKVSVVVVTYNSEHTLEPCLRSVAQTVYDNFETILVDDGSTDETVECARRLQKSVPNLSVVRSDSNVGAAAARNRGALSARGRYLAFLDSDTEVDPSWLTDPISTMEADPRIAVIQCKLMLMTDRDKYDYAGDYLSQFGFLTQVVRTGQHDDGTVFGTDVFGVKSAGMIINREVFFASGKFDEDFFIYLEETDLCWRVWFHGYRVHFIPTSIVYHNFGDIRKLSSQRTKFLSKYYGSRNYVTMLLKNPGAWQAMRIIPIHLLLWSGIILWHTFRRRFVEAQWVAYGVLNNAARFKETWKKRLLVQGSIRRIGDRELEPFIMKRMPLAYFYQKLTHQDSGWNL